MASGTSAALAPPAPAAAMNNVNSAQTAQSAAGGDQAYQKILSDFRSGAIDLNTAQSQIGALPTQYSQGQSADGSMTVNTPYTGNMTVSAADLAKNNAGNSQFNPGTTGSQLLSQFMQDPTVSRQVAQSQALSSPTLAGDFGKGGQLDQAQGQYSTASGNLAQDRNALMGRDQSYGLTDQDLAAYSQAAGNTARMFGAQGSAMSQNLANRGLGAADSGTAQQGFSNAYGNQMEQLAGLQSQIAQNRIQTAQGLAQARTNADLSQQAQAQQYGLGLSGQGQNAINATQAGNLQAQGQQYNQSIGAADAGMQQQGLNQSINDTSWQQQQASSFNPLSILTGAASSLAGGIAGGLGSQIAPSRINYSNMGSGGAGAPKPLGS